MFLKILLFFQHIVRFDQLLHGQQPGGPQQRRRQVRRRIRTFRIGRPTSDLLSVPGGPGRIPRQRRRVEYNSTLKILYEISSSLV